MGTLTALQIVSQSARRARDPGMTATAKSDIFKLMTRMQSLVNAGASHVIQSATLHIEPLKQAYGISANLPNAIQVVDVRDSTGRSLDGPMPYQSLKYLNIDWWRETGPELRSWAPVGHDLMIIRPGLEVGTTVTVFYTALCSPFNVDGDLLTLPDEDVDLIYDGVELLLDLKARDYSTLKTLFEGLTQKMKALSTETR